MNIFKNLMNRLKQHIILQFLISYLIILIIPMTIFGVAYSYWINVAQEEAYQRNLTFLEQTGIIVNSYIAEIKNLSNQLWYEEEIDVFLRMKSPEEDGTLLSDVLVSASRFRTNFKLNNYIYDTFIYSYINGMTIGKNAIEIKKDKCWTGILKLTDYTPEDFCSLVLGLKGDKYLPMTSISTNGNKKNVIVFLQQLQIGVFSKKDSNFSLGTPGGALIVLIDGDNINKLLRESPFQAGGGYVFITDNNGQLFAGNPDKEIFDYFTHKDDNSLNDGKSGVGKGYYKLKIETGNMLVSFIDSSNGWKYVAVTPESAVLGKLGNVRNIMLALFLATFIIGIIIAYFISSNTTRPIRVITEEINGGKIGKQNKDYCTSIKEYFDYLKNENLSLNEVLESQKVLARQTLFNRILYGGFESEDECRAFAKWQGFESMLVGSFLPVIVCVSVSVDNHVNSEIDKWNIAKLLVKQEIVKVFSCDLVEDIEYNMIAFVYRFGGGDEVTGSLKSILEDGIRELSVRLRLKYCIHIAVYGGNICTSITEISGAYRNARYALGEQTCFNDGVVWYIDENKEIEKVFFPVDVEKSLSNSLRSGDANEAIKCVDMIYFENMYRRKLTQMQLEELKQKLKDIFNRQIIQIYKSGIPECISVGLMNFEHEEVMEKIIQKVKVMCIALCKEADENRCDSRRQIVDAILELIKKHFNDSSFGLMMLSRKMGYSEPHLSNVFYEVMGEHFSRYLERVRLNAACDMLLKEGVSIEKIAENVGYSSVGAFRRAFKRVYNNTPGEFRAQSFKLNEATITR